MQNGELRTQKQDTAQRRGVLFFMGSIFPACAGDDR